MRASVLAAIGIGLLSTAGGAIHQDAAPVAGRGTIRGRIVDATDNRPIVGATVTVYAEVIREARRFLTSTDGRFEFAGLPGGSYSIRADKMGFVDTRLERFPRDGAPIVLTDTGSVDDAEVRLSLGAVVTGHVISADGVPVPGVQVSALLPEFTTQELLRPDTLRKSGEVDITDDHGEYRLYGLRRGRYALAAWIYDPYPVSRDATGVTTAYAPTFYPSSAEATSSRLLDLDVGQVLNNATITLKRVPVSTVSGSVVDAQGRLVTSGGVVLRLRGTFRHPDSPVFNGPILRDGTFAIHNVTPGEYTARANVPSTRRGPAVEPEDSPFTIVTVDGAAVSNIHVVSRGIVTVAGHITLEESNTATTIRPSDVRVATYAWARDDAWAGVGSTAGPLPSATADYSFSIRTVPGHLGLIANAPEGWQVKAIRAAGRDVTDTGVEVGANGIADAEIELTRRQPSVTVTAHQFSVEFTKDCAVLLFSRDPNKWLPPLQRRYFDVPVPSADGRFRATLPAGDYYAVAVDRGGLFEWANPEFLTGISGKATPFSIALGDNRSLDLRIINPRNP